MRGAGARCAMTTGILKTPLSSAGCSASGKMP